VPSWSYGRSARIHGRMAAQPRASTPFCCFRSHLPAGGRHWGAFLTTALFRAWPASRAADERNRVLIANLWTSDLRVLCPAGVQEVLFWVHVSTSRKIMSMDATSAVWSSTDDEHGSSGDSRSWRVDEGLRGHSSPPTPVSLLQRHQALGGTSLILLRWSQSIRRALPPVTHRPAAKPRRCAVTQMLCGMSATHACAKCGACSSRKLSLEHGAVQARGSD